MKFTYAFKTSDGIRHEDSIEAASREEAFSSLRAKGIRPIKVVAEDGSKANGATLSADGGIRAKRYLLRNVAIGACCGVAFALMGVWLMMSLARGSVGEAKGASSEGAEELRVATPLPRQEIQGDRKRIGKVEDVFSNKVDVFFARFAEPGRLFFAPADEWPSGEEIDTVIQEPLRVSEDELTEAIDLKRIVAGIRREYRLYVRGGGTADGFVRELVRRQEHEIAVRKRAVDHLFELLNAPESKDKLKVAYEFWLTANAQLASMGIFQMPIPEVLRSYQQTLMY